MDLVDSIWLVDFGPNFPAEPGHKRPALIVGPTDGFADFLSDLARREGLLADLLPDALAIQPTTVR